MSGTDVMPAAIRHWHAVAAARDVAGLETLLAADAVFESPVVHTPQVGRAIVTRYLAAAFQVLNNVGFHYPNQWFGERSAVLEFATEIDGIAVNGIDMISWDDQDRITHFKVMIRPLKAINLVHEKMRETLMAMGPRPA
ncbi:nuclear transport factor 2 family protein [Phreatobacter sp.]|uniref:nuclear transport factor 2 family protein n=1 Tax=Phreatobacter sp. TaxID=1966341 RepID=UPI0025F05DAD|nr:nuclear transport factor 2 family protein [Phreatobacter sp.]